MTAKIKHLAICSGNSKVLLDFYASLFKMERDAGQVVTDGYVGMNVNPRGRGRQAGIDHFGLEVDDAEALMARCHTSYPQINFLKRPSNRPFAGISTHDPAGNVFDLSQAGMENRRGVYAEAPEELRQRRVDHFELRTVNPAALATFYQDVYGLLPASQASEDGKYALTDGRITLVIARWNIMDYAGTGIERPAIEHLGFAVENLQTFKADLDELMESRPEFFTTYTKESTEGARRLEILDGCSRGEFCFNDPDGVLLDVREG
ncbi:MAG: hypothetical protein HW416_932 [Chloroflexi bacterium]|nr:hypothetical protein [Chloroflexota bacterium]